MNPLEQFNKIDLLAVSIARFADFKKAKKCATGRRVCCSLENVPPGQKLSGS